MWFLIAAIFSLLTALGGIAGQSAHATGIGIIYLLLSMAQLFMSHAREAQPLNTAQRDELPAMAMIFYFEALAAIAGMIICVVTAFATFSHTEPISPEPLGTAIEVSSLVLLIVFLRGGYRLAKNLSEQTV